MILELLAKDIFMLMRKDFNWNAQSGVGIICKTNTVHANYKWKLHTLTFYLNIAYIVLETCPYIRSLLYKISLLAYPST